MEDIQKTSQSMWFALASAGLFALVGIIAIFWASRLVYQAADPIALVFVPGMEERAMMHKVVEAGGFPLHFGGLPNVLVAQFTNQDMAHVSAQTGAMFVMNANTSGLCSINEGLPK